MLAEVYKADWNLNLIYYQEIIITKKLINLGFHKCIPIMTSYQSVYLISLIFVRLNFWDFCNLKNFVKLKVPQIKGAMKIKDTKHIYVTSVNKYMLFTGWEVCIGRNCTRGLEYCPRLVLRPIARAQFLPINRPTFYKAGE